MIATIATNSYAIPDSHDSPDSSDSNDCHDSPVSSQSAAVSICSTSACSSFLSLFYREWIRKSFPVGREGLTVLKSILPCL